MEEVLQQFQDLKIQLEEITSATNNFNVENYIGVGGFGKVYNGELSHSKGRSMVAIKRLSREQDQDQGDREFLKEITMLSQYKHKNLISLLGFCYQGGEAILVYELASNGSLDVHLGSSELTWSKRIKICLDAAKGLRHLHDPRGTHQRLIHCDVKSGNILLDDQWNAKIADFGFSTMGPAKELQSTVINLAAGTLGYCDPKYVMTNTLTKESDVYSFGVVLFEVLCGRLCYSHNGRKILVPTWTEKYEQKKLYDIIFKHTTPDQTMDQRALETFSGIAYDCLKKHREDRPKMDEVVIKLETALRYQEAYSELQNEYLQAYRGLTIQLKEITSVTNNFDDSNCIGEGGFGKVYKGELFHFERRSMVAIKRLNPHFRQGDKEFVKEIVILSRYRHENLISLLGFCNQGDESILVYEYASRGSLDGHLSSPYLTWSQRIKICLDAAKGLSYLHDPDTHQRLIHCDVKSATILLDDQWIGKVSDFGLSKELGPAKKKDPIFERITRIKLRESDIYSFGVVLFEVLCGTLCCTHSHDSLLPLWIMSYEENKLDNIMFRSPNIQPLDQSALERFSYIAHRCLIKIRRRVPTMVEVVTNLETALASQVLGERKPLFDYKEMTKTAEPPLKYRSKVELWKLLSKGVLLNYGKTWFSLDTKGEHCEMISVAECLDSGPCKFESNLWSANNSRFAVSTYRSENGIFKTRVRTQFLSPGVTYNVNLVFKMHLKMGRTCHDLISLRYKLHGESKTTISYLADKRGDGWYAELYQFTSDQRAVDLEILFDGFDQYSCAFIEVEGIEFRPLEKEDDNVDIQPIPYSDTNWEQKLPADYEDIMKWSKYSLRWTTKREAYSVIREGFLIDDGDKWFSLAKNGKKCHMLSARAACIEGRMYTHLVSSPKSRFGEALEFNLRRLVTSSPIQSHLLSPHTTYASYLVYKLPKDQSGFEAPVKVKDLDSDHIWYIYLATPQTPVIRTKAEQNSYSPLSRPKTKGLPQLRNDGWMEVQIWEFRTADTTESNHMRLKLSGCGDTIPGGLIVQGVEFRPV